MLIDPETIWLCSACDIIIKKWSLKRGEKAFCPNCNQAIYDSKKYSVVLPITISIIGLIALFPACYLVLLKMIFWTGDVKTHSIFSGIIDFASQGMFVPCVVILLGTFIVPLMTFCFSLWITLPITSTYKVKRLGLLFKIFYYLRYWGMLEVYLLSVIVGLFKLDTFAKVSPDIGLFALTILMCCQFIVCFLLKPSWLRAQIEEKKLLYEAVS
ncbi:MAG: paraquat-inducible protein A [Endozoicomonadaceae bacterium]|nr:paraquat-inducible protein A [Endozoicomonadaceae bacterium]